MTTASELVALVRSLEQDDEATTAVEAILEEHKFKGYSQGWNEGFDFLKGTLMGAFDANRRA
jgi:hypothetical protein